jgi:hypothetical protein
VSAGGGGRRNNEESISEDEMTFDPPFFKGAKTYDYLMNLVNAQQVGEVGCLALNLIEVLQLGRLDKGSLSTSGGGRWLSSAKKTTKTDKESISSR